MRPPTAINAAAVSFAGVPEMARLRKWLRSGLLALADQGLISGSNFALGICLARFAGPESYGAYMLLFASFLLIANMYQALVLEPPNVLAFSLFPGRNDRYLRIVLAMHVLFTVVFAVAGLALLWAAPALGIRGLLANALAGLLIAAPCTLLYWLARSFAYLEFAPAAAVKGSVLYCGVLALCVFAAFRSGGLTPKLVFGCVAAASAAASLRLLVPRVPWGPAESGEPDLGTVWGRHWNYGRWGLGSVGLSWAQTNSISFISGSLLGLREVGGLNALVAVLLPMFQVLTSATRLSLPRIAQIYTAHGITATRRPVIRVAVVLVALASAYAAAVSVLHNTVFHHLYGTRFMPYAWLLPFISLHVVAWAGITACDIGFNSIQAPHASFRIKLLMVAVMIPVNVLVTWRFGLPGAVIGVPAFSTLTAILMGMKLRSVWLRAEAGVEDIR